MRRSRRATSTPASKRSAALLKNSLRCFNAGVEVGNISANGYCAASLAIDGLLDPGFISQPPLPFCGQNLVFGCKTEYVSVATREFPGCLWAYAFKADDLTANYIVLSGWADAKTMVDFEEYPRHRRAALMGEAQKRRRMGRRVCGPRLRR